MTIEGSWHAYSRAQVASETDEYGVYAIGNDSGEILYIGQGHLKTRLQSHLPDTGNEPVPGTRYKREYTGSSASAERREKEEIDQYHRSHGGLPPYNDRRPQ